MTDFERTSLSGASNSTRWSENSNTMLRWLPEPDSHQIPLATGSTLTTCGGGTGTDADVTAAGAASGAASTSTAFFDTRRSNWGYLSSVVVRRFGIFTPVTSS